VVQPGVESSDDSVSLYAPENAKPLSRWLTDSAESIVFEAHSTDYQPSVALDALVQDDFRILKVGPGLTFALREVLYSIDAVARVLHPESPRIALPRVLEKIMTEKPAHWIGYYGESASSAIKRHFSYSDRIRYYWNEPDVIAAVAALRSELDGVEIPETLVSQFLPDIYKSLPRGQCVSFDILVSLKLQNAMSAYVNACRAGKSA
jgi:D-tagatose-bisphosphate aldolase class II non-catalytic subunit